MQIHPDILNQSLWTDIMRMPKGKKRRYRLVEHLMSSPSYPDFPVNRRGALILDKDSDLKYLLRKGILKKTRRGSHTRRVTYLELCSLKVKAPPS